MVFLRIESERKLAREIQQLRNEGVFLHYDLVRKDLIGLGLYLGSNGELPKSILRPLLLVFGVVPLASMTPEEKCLSQEDLLRLFEKELRQLVKTKSIKEARLPGIINRITQEFPAFAALFGEVE